MLNVKIILMHYYSSEKQYDILQMHLPLMLDSTYITEYINHHFMSNAKFVNLERHDLYIMKHCDIFILESAQSYYILK